MEALVAALASFASDSSESFAIFLSLERDHFYIYVILTIFLRMNA
jgi:hypothetical protein